MSPREPIPTRTPSRFRTRPRICALSVRVPDVRTVSALACLDDDAPRVTPGHPTALARIMGDALSPWDERADEREDMRVSALDLIARLYHARVRLRALPPERYTFRPVMPSPPPLRQVGVAGDLAAALSSLADVPAWVDPAEALERVRAVIETPMTTRAQMLAAMART